MGRQKTPLSRQLADIDLKLLRVFKTVVDMGGFSAAEASLNIGTSTISNYISELEKRLNMRLCTRGRAGFSVSEHGKVVYEATQELIEALEQFRNRINLSHDNLMGDLHLAVVETAIYIPNNSIVASLKAFRAIAPSVRLHVSTLTAEEIPAAVTEGSTHVGITALHHPSPNLRSEPLFEECMQLYCGRGHPLFEAVESKQTLQQLNNSVFVESSRLRSGLSQDPAMATWHMQASALQQEARLAILLTGEFVGYLPEHMASLANWQKDLRCLFPQRFSYRNTYHCLTKPTAGGNRIVDSFRACLGL